MRLSWRSSDMRSYPTSALFAAAWDTSIDNAKFTSVSRMKR
ncbi:hypothetical protein LINPERHAP1_LOCUS17571 [Linum perenne]